MFDCFVHLEVEDLSVIYEWRLQAERMMRQQHGEKSAMTDEQVVDFVDRFMPAYKQYLPRLRASPLVPGHQLRITVNKGREIVSAVEL